MRIDRLQVKNFKGFEARTFDFPRSESGSGSFHLIVGHNGQGKTSALDALAVAAGAWLLGIRGHDSRHIREEDIRIKILTFEDTERIEPQLPVVVEAQGMAQGQNIDWKRELISRKTTTKDARKLKLLAEKAVQQLQQGEVSVTLPLVSYYGAGRLWLEPNAPRTIETKLEWGKFEWGKSNTRRATEEEKVAERYGSRLAGYRFSVDSRSSPGDLLAWLRLEQRLSDHRGRDSIQFRVVKGAIQKAVEGCTRIAFDPRLGLLLDIEGQARLPFGNLSDGQRNMVAMIGDLAFKAAQLNPHLGEDVLNQTPGIVLIDELDLHLHPRWQHHVVDDLREMFPLVQFVATTHSPFVIQSMRSGEELIVLDGDSTASVDNLGIEAIAVRIMGVEHPEVSPRYREMLEVAKGYLAELDKASRSPAARLETYKKRLAARLAPFADNPAFQAVLEVERIAKLGE